MIHVSAQRLDLHALDDREEIRVLTGAGGIQILAGNCTGGVATQIMPTGVGKKWIADENVKNRWLNLAALEPMRLFWLTALRGDPSDRSSTVILFRDITPSKPNETKTEAPTDQKAPKRLLGRRG